MFRGLVSQKFTAPDESLTNMSESTSGVVWAFSILNGESSLSHSDIEHLYFAGLKPIRLTTYYVEMNMNTQCFDFSDYVFLFSIIKPTCVDITKDQKA